MRARPGLGLVRSCLAGAALASAASTASATWSIILTDTRTGEIAIGCATCLTNLDLRASTPTIVTGVGAGAAQSFVDVTGRNRILLRDGLALGRSPADILASLAAFDPQHQTRQYGIADVQGRSTTFTGTGAGAWAGGRSGSFTSDHGGIPTTITYAIQGNVLAGEPVVLAAVQAAQSTPGDLPAKLLAAMEAARALGGDGRCSCPTGTPEACGTPPPAPFKSAHIAYVIVAREGDADGAHGLYALDSTPATLVAADMNADGRPDLIAPTLGPSAVTVRPSITPPGVGFGILGPAIRASLNSGPSAAAVADMNADGRPDVIATSASTNRVSVALANATGGTFAAPLDTNVGSGPNALAIADFNLATGPDVATLNTGNATISIRFNNGTGRVTGTANVAVGPDPRSIIATDLTGDGRPDIATAIFGQSRLQVLRNAAPGLFTAANSFDIPVPANPAVLRSADLDADGDTDLIVLHRPATGNASVSVLRNTPGGWQTVEIPLPTAAQDLAIGDINADGLRDVVVSLASNELGTILQGPAFAFALAHRADIGPTPFRLALGDFSGDGDIDAAATTSDSSLILVENVGGRFQSGTGTGFGDYWMNFNVAFAGEGDPEPVFTLQSQYDAWRTALVGKTDAVRSVVEAPTLFAGGSPRELLVRLRDWQGQPLGEGVLVRARRLAGSATTAPALEAATDAEGIARFTLAPIPTASGLPTTPSETWTFTTTDAGREVRLMPRTRVDVPPCPADFDASGSPSADISDLLAFFAAYTGGEASADLDRSGGTPDDRDLTIFFDAFANGC